MPYYAQEQRLKVAALTIVTRNGDKEWRRKFSNHLGRGEPRVGTS